MVIPNSWFDDSDNTSRTPPDEIFRYAPRRLDKVRRSLYAENDDCQNEGPLLDCSVVSCEVASDEVVKDMGTTDEVAMEMSTSDEVPKKMSTIDDVAKEMSTSVDVAKEMSTSDEVPKEMSTSDDVAKEMSIIDDAANEMNTSDEEQETHVNDISCVMELKENTKNCREDQSEEFQAQVIMVRVVSSSLFLTFTIAPGSLTILLNNALKARYWHPVVYFSAIFFKILCSQWKPDNSELVVTPADQFEDHNL